MNRTTFLTTAKSTINDIWSRMPACRQLGSQNEAFTLSGHFWAKPRVSRDNGRRAACEAGGRALHLLRRSAKVATAVLLAMSWSFAHVSPAHAQNEEIPLDCQNLTGDELSQCILDMSEGFEEEEGVSGDQLQEIESIRSITCLATEEDLYSPSARAMNWARATPSTQMRLRQPRRWQFDLAGNSITVNGKPVKPLMSDGRMAALSIVDAVGSFDDPRAQYLSPDEKEQWEGAMKFLKGLEGQVAATTGLQGRLFVVNFDESAVTLGTLAKGDLIEMQAMRCF